MSIERVAKIEFSHGRNKLVFKVDYRGEMVHRICVVDENNHHPGTYLDIEVNMTRSDVAAAFRTLATKIDRGS